MTSSSNPNVRPFSERALLVLALLLGATFWFACRHFTVDDAYIAYRHARNIAHGDGPVMNPGERVEGVSNLPWTLVLGVAAHTGWAPDVAGPVLSSLCGLACILGAFFAGRREKTAGAATLLCASGVPFIAWSASGMETAAYAFALLALVVGIESILTASRAFGPQAAGGALGLVASLRPEGAIFGLASLSALRQEKRLVLPFLLAAGVVWGALVVFRIGYYGDWLPNPARAKSPEGWSALAPGLAYALRFVVAYPLVLFLAWRSGSIARAFIVTQIAFIVLAGGDRFPGYRFAIVLWPILAVAAARSLSRSEPSSRHGRMRTAAVLFAAGGAFLAFWPHVALPLAEGIAGLERLQRPIVSYAELLTSEIRHVGVVALALAAWLATRHLSRKRRGAGLALLVACTLLPSGFDPALRALRAPDPSARLGRIVGLWMHEHLPPGTLVATNAAGALPYFSELPVVDMLGLTDRHIARSAAESSAWIGHERGDAAYVLRRAPDLILFGGPEGSVDPWPFPGDRALAQDPEFRARYELERVPLDGFELVFYRRSSDNSGRP